MIENLDPLLIISMILMQIGARYLDLELTEFQRQIIKNRIVQAIILFGIIYIPVRDIKKTILIIFLIYLIIHVLLNENHKFNIYSKKWLYTEGIIKEYTDFKNKYYMNLKKIIE
jgi:hypothetical protein